MIKPYICASLTNPKYVDKANEADIVEVRIDILGSEWTDVIKYLRKPWIACNRLSSEGGYWVGDELKRINELVKAVKLGASIVDVELSSKDVESVVSMFKSMGVKVIVSKHILTHTPEVNELRTLVNKLISVGADIWKVATKANTLEDNLIVLRMLKEFRVPGIAIAMGELGLISRVLSPLIGGYLTYVALDKGLESAPGQLTIKELKSIYELLGITV